MPSRRLRVLLPLTATGIAVALGAALLPVTLSATAAPPADTRAAADVRAAAQPRVGSLDLLTDPFLQAPTADGVSVVWMTEYAGTDHRVLLGATVDQLTEAQLEAAAAGTLPAGVTAVEATSFQMSRTAEDSGSQLADKPTPEQGIVAREVHRHEAVVTGLAPGTDTPYRVVSSDDDGFVASGTFTLSPAAAPGESQQILLTSDHQAMVNTPANLQKAKETIGDIDAVFVAGDLVNIPDRASEWFDDTRGSAFFPVLQGRAGRVSTGGVEYVGGEIVQSAPIFPAVGNHEVQGRIDGMTSLNTSFNAPVPTAVAEREYAKVAAEVNPTGDEAVKQQWLEDNSFSTTTYEEVFSLPETSPGGETYYATTVGDVRLISLYSTRIWRGTTANPEPTERTANSRYQEAAANLADPMAQGYGEHVFESLEVGSEQLSWLEEELASEEFRSAPIKIVMLHEGPQGLGDNVMPVFAHPERIETRDSAGALTSVRYEYRTEDNMLVRDLQPLLEDAGVDLVHNGHSHLWNRFKSRSGTNFLETSNTGNSYGAYHGLSNRTRPVPPAPWDEDNYLPIGNPGGLKPIVPNVEPFLNPDGVPLPFVQSNDLAVFTALDTGANTVTSWAYDVKTPDREPWVIDRFTLGTSRSTVDAPTATGRYGTALTVTGEVTGGEAAATGEVVVSDGARELATADLVDGAFTAALPARALRPGTHRLTVGYAGDDASSPATGTVTVRVAKADARVAAKAARKGRAVVVTTRVRATGLTPTGRVEVRYRGKRVAVTSLRNGSGTARIAVRKLGRPGAKALVVRYAGSATAAAATDRLRVTVRR